jgi:ubiquinone/menaquinone biosynthesis C-methylase UbiE
MSLLFITIPGVIILVAFLCLSRVDLPHKVSNEGIDNKDMATAFNRISLWPQFKILRKIIMRRLSRYHLTGIIIDIGCGPGYLLEIISRQFPSVAIIGIDSSEEMVIAAKARAESSIFLKRATFLVGNVGNLPLQDGSVDFAVSTLSLHHWLNPLKGFEEIHRVLKPGGQVLLFDLRRDSRRFFYYLLRFAQAMVVPSALRRASEPLGSLLASYSVAELKDLLAKTKFEKKEIIEGSAWAYAWAKKKE